MIRWCRAVLVVLGVALAVVLLPSASYAATCPGTSTCAPVALPAVLVVDPTTTTTTTTDTPTTTSTTSAATSTSTATATPTTSATSDPAALCGTGDKPCVVALEGPVWLCIFFTMVVLVFLLSLHVVASFGGR